MPRSYSWATACLALLISASALAEGSRSLYPSGYEALDGRARSALRVDPDELFVGSIPDTHFLYVYAEAGEYILVGSRNRIDANNSGRGDRDIRIYNPQDFGTPGVEIPWVDGSGVSDKEPAFDIAFSCKEGLDPGSVGMPTGAGPHYFDDNVAGNGIEGLIGPDGASSGGNARVAELAGPNSADNSVTVTDGWKPCAYRAPETGIYGVWFEDWTGADILSATSVTNPDPTNPGIGDVGVSVWDVSVRADASSTTDLNGRLFTYKWTGASNQKGPSDREYFTLFYTTLDGYRYRQEFRGISPANHIFYSNRSGFLDQGQPLYKSLVGADGDVLPLPPGISSQLPQFPVFFSDIDPGGPNSAEVDKVLTALGIPLVPVLPTVSNLFFEGSVAGSLSTLGAGGTFTFSSADTISYRIVISRDSIDFDPSNPSNRVLRGLVGSGNHRIIWDGKANDGSDFPVGGPYTFELVGRNGEAHFPMLDVELNDFGGPTLTRLNGGASGRTNVYFDDRGYITKSGDAVGTPGDPLPVVGSGDAPDPIVALEGVDSSDPSLSVVATSLSPNYYRQWTMNGSSTNDLFGDNKGLDTWVYQASAPAFSDLTIIAASSDVDLATSVSVPILATPGDTVFGEVLFQNVGTTDATIGATYSMSFPNGCPAALAFSFPGNGAASGSCSGGSVSFNNLPAVLAGGQQFTVLFNYQAPASGNVPVASEVSVDPLETIVANNIDNGITIVDIVPIGPTLPVAPTVSKAFSVSPIFVGETSTLTITLNNANPFILTLTSNFVDTLPMPVVVAATPNVGGTCSGTKTAAPGGTTVTYASGSTILAAGSCTISVDVTSDTAGIYTNTIPAGGLQTDAGANANPASANLEVLDEEVVVDAVEAEPVPAMPKLLLALLAALLALIAIRTTTVSVRR